MNEIYSAISRTIYLLDTIIIISWWFWGCFKIAKWNKEDKQ